MNHTKFCQFMKWVNEIFHSIAMLSFIGGMFFLIGMVGYAFLASIFPSIANDFIQSNESIVYFLYALVMMLFGLHLFYGSKIMKKRVS